jgi:2,4-dienoyl-CoA reductase (NADPH2)
MSQYAPAKADPADTAAIRKTLKIGRLELKNCLLRSSISGRIDNYDGSGTPARVNFEERFARGGVAAIISSHVPITPRGRVLPNYAMIDRDERIRFWSTVGWRVKQHNCHYILQLSHSGRQQDMGGVENFGLLPDGVTSRADYFNGLRAKAMDEEAIQAVIDLFARAAERVAAANLDGIELHSANGYLFTQFLSSAINDRRDRYGGSLENRARFLLSVIEAIQKSVGKDFPLIVKVTGHDHNSAAGLLPRAEGNGIEDAIQIARWVEQAGVHAIHVSTGNMFPHPLNPAGPLPVDVARITYQSMISSGRWTFRNFLAFRYALTRRLLARIWRKSHPFNGADGRVIPDKLEGFAAADALVVKQSVKIPVLLTGGFQTAHGIGRVLRSGACDAVTMARPLLANPGLPLDLLEGWDGPKAPLCTYCNKCLLHVIEHPLGCYDESRFVDRGGREEMLREVFEIFEDYYEQPPSASGEHPSRAPRSVNG